MPGKVIMKIIVDAMSGDNAPHEIIRGALRAKDAQGVQIVLVGEEAVIRDSLRQSGRSEEDVEICHAPDVITMEDSPLAIREKTDSSMRVCFRLLKEGAGDAIVGAGNTGAMHVGSTLFSRRIPGVRRSALGAILPMSIPVLLIDAGANIQVTEEFLLQFAVMGSIYMKKMFNIGSPRVGLLNNGTEDHKGTPLYVNTYRMLASTPGINFVGNVEGKDIPTGICDVLVCDGFTGNVALKTIEGMGSFIMKSIKTSIMGSFRSKLGGLLIKKNVAELRKRFDASEYGGAPFLGIGHPVIKAHGSSDANAFYNAIRQAVTYVETDVVGDIEKAVAELKSQPTLQGAADAAPVT